MITPLKGLQIGTKVMRIEELKRLLIQVDRAALFTVHSLELVIVPVIVEFLYHWPPHGLLL